MGFEFIDKTFIRPTQQQILLCADLAASILEDTENYCILSVLYVFQRYYVNGKF